MATSFEAIRDRQIAIIQALTPSMLAGNKFRVALDEIDFRDWADAKPLAAFRRFTIADLFEYEDPEVSGGDVEFVRTREEIAIAYPRDYRYGTDNSRDASDCMRSDMRQINTAVGIWGTNNYVAGSTAITELSTDIERTEAVTLLVMSYAVYFYRSI